MGEMYPTYKEKDFLNTAEGNKMQICTVLPFIIKKLAYATVIFCHGQSIARRGLAIWTNRLNIQALHAHHLHHCFPAHSSSIN
jgi:hypothetical protein